MQLTTKDGISCDYCGAQYRKEFEYYSIDIRDAYMQHGLQMPLDNIRRLKIEFSFDICSQCYNDLTKLIIKFYKPTSLGFVCNLTGVIINNDTTYCYVDITKVMVKVPLSGKADITTSPRELEFTISEAAGAEIVNKVLNCRQKATQQWHVKSST